MKVTIPLMYEDHAVVFVDGVPMPVSEYATLGRCDHTDSAIRLTLPKGRATALLPKTMFSAELIETLFRR